MRICKICGNENFLDGYCVDDGIVYYCSDECLHHDYTEEEWEEMYESGWGYWTQWEEEENE